MFRSSSTSLIVRGVLAAIVGVVAIAWPGVTILALVILFAVYAFMDAGLQGTRAFTSRSAGPVFGHLLVALIDIGAGIFAIVWPGPTALVLVIVVAVWAFVGGFTEIFAGFQSGERAGPAPCSPSAAWSPSCSASCFSPAPASACSPLPCCSACTASSSASRRSPWESRYTEQERACIP